MGAFLFLYGAWIPVSKAASDAEELAAIQKGLAHLYTTQQPDGSWTGSGSEQSATAAAAFAFLSQRDNWDGNAPRYEAAVNKAISRLLSTAKTVELRSGSDGAPICPNASVTCIGVVWDGNGESTYSTALAAQAFAAYGIVAGPNAVAAADGPLAGMTWSQIAQAVTNAIGVGQVRGGTGGGWGKFISDSQEADLSSTLWAVSALLYDESVGASTPAEIKDGLRTWLGKVQEAGGGCDQPGKGRCSHADTGAWLVAMRFVGADLVTPQLQSAVTFLNAHWQAPADDVRFGNFGHPYAMWAVHNGLALTIGLRDSTQIANFSTSCGASGARCGWAEDYAEWLVRNQRPDGTWEGYAYWTDPISTALDIAILGGAHVPLGPYSCPLSKSFWANTPADWPVTSLTVGGHRYSMQELLALLSDANASDLSHDLVGDLIAAKLNVIRGSDPIPVAGAIARGDATLRLLKGTHGEQVSSLSGRASTLPEDRDLLKAYNAGSLTSACSTTGSPTSGSWPDESAVSTQHGAGITTKGSVAALSASIRATHPSAAKGVRSRLRKGVTALSASPDGNSLATGSTDKNFRIWSTTTGLQSVVLSGSVGLPTSVVFTPGGSTVATVSRDSVVRIWDSSHGNAIATLNGHEQAIDAIAVSADGKTLATAGEDTRIMLWDLSSNKLRKVIWGPTNFVNALSFSPLGQTLAIGGEDSRVLVSDATTGKVLFTLLGHSAAVNAVAFSPNGTVLASGGQDTVIHLWDPVKGVQRQALSGHTAPVRTVVFSPDGQQLASGGEDSQVLIWNTATGALTRTLTSTGSVNVLVFDPTGRFLASASDTGQVTIWSTRTWRPLLTITVP
jgi:WD40 repeat protein